MTTDAVALVDDRLLIGRLLSDEPASQGQTATSALWYYRACRAAVLGAGGHLSGPFARLGRQHQHAAIRRLLELDKRIQLPDPRRTVPAMARLAERHPQLNLLNLEAAAAALTLRATVLLSPKAAVGVLPAVLDQEDVPWEVAEPGW